MHVCELRTCQCGANGLHCHTSHTSSSRPSSLPTPSGRSTPWRWMPTCSRWAAPPGFATSGTPTGVPSAPSTRPPYSEAGLSPRPAPCHPHGPLLPLLTAPPSYFFPLPLHPVLRSSLSLTEKHTNTHTLTEIYTCEPRAFSL